MQADAQQSGTILETNILHVISTSPNPTDTIKHLLLVAKNSLNARDAAYCALGTSALCIAAQDDQAFRKASEALRDLPSSETADQPLAIELWGMNALVWHLTEDALFVSVFEHQPDFETHHQNALTGIFDALRIAAKLYLSEERAKHQQRMAVSILNSIADPLLVVDRNRLVLEMNTAAEIVFKTSHDHAQGQSLDAVIQSDELLALFLNPNQSEWVSDEEETFIPRSEPVYDAEGDLQGWVLALRDITQFKKLNRNQSEFTRMFSHDLRSPLTSMQGFANMLELQLVGDLNEKQAHFVDKILSGIAQMTALVENIQDAGRFDPETGFYEMTRSACDVSELVTRIVDNHLVPAEKQELKLATHLADDIPIINADATMIERAVTNLVDNAIKYTPNGGSVTVGVARVDDSLQVSVQDTGFGISEENQRQLFRRHVRIPREEHKKVKGSGLGLFIVRSVAQHHGGEAWVESAEGKGATFFISIPLEGPNLLSQQ